ncbi:Uncharacterised protein [Shewanella baltica]|nr:Uncharacterised protein [Shewanella baltica]
MKKFNGIIFQWFIFIGAGKDRYIFPMVIVSVTFGIQASIDMSVEIAAQSCYRNPL